MKKLLIAFALCSTLLTGCESDNSDYSDYQGEARYFKIISNESCGDIIYDTRTGVEYWRSTSVYNSGTLTVLVDADGKPLIYDRSEEE